MSIGTLGVALLLSFQATVVCPVCEQAQQLTEAGDTAGAIALLRTEAPRNPSSAAIWGNLGLLLAQAAPALERDFAMRIEAENALDRALQLNPQNPRWLYGHAILLRKRGIRLDADRLLERALTASHGPRSDLTPREIAKMYAERGRILEEQAQDFEGYIAMGEWIVDVNITECMELGPFCLNFVSPQAFHESLFAVEPAENLMRRQRQQMMEMFSTAFRMDPSLDVAARGLLAEYARRGDWDSYVETAAAHVRAAGTDGWAQAYLAAGYFRLGQYELAELLFEGALARLAMEDREVLNDVSGIVSRAAEQQYLAAAGERRQQIQEHLWKISNPFYLSDVNERRLAHFTRVTLAELWFGVPQTGTRGYETDRGEILIRYGEPRFIRQVPRDALWDMNPEAVTEENPYGLVMTEPGAGRWILWTYDTKLPSFVFEKGLRSRTARHGAQTQSRIFADDLRFERPSTYDVPGVVTLPHQTVRFKGERAPIEVDLFALLPGDTLAAAGEVQGKAGIFFTPSIAGQDVVRIESPIVFEERPRILTFRVPLNPGAYPYSLEVTTLDGRIRARSRTTMLIPDWSTSFSASDILLGHSIEPIREPVVDRRDIRIFASGDLTFEEGAPVALYFELYNLAFSEDSIGRFRITLQIKDEQQSVVGGVVRRLAELLGRTEQDRPITWERTVAGPVDRVPEWFTVTLGAQTPGVYQIEIMAEDLLSGETTRVTRPFEIISRGTH